MQIDKETINDITSYFPYLTNNEPFYHHLLFKYCHIQQNDALYLVDNKVPLKWKIQMNTLKKLDQIQTSWKAMTEPPKLKHIPPILLSKTTSSTLNSIQLTTWDWKEKSKSFPLLPTTDLTTPSVNKKPSAQQQRVQMNANVLDRFSFLTNKYTSHMGRQLNHLHKNKYLDHPYGKPKTLAAAEQQQQEKPRTFQPQRSLKSFQRISMQKTKNQSDHHQRKICELDNPRFNFD